MARLLLTRLALFVPTLFAASVILFIAINVVPGSAARSALGVDATPQAIMRFEAMNGLNRPLVLQYTEWLGKALRGDLGTSFQNRVPVAPEILKRLPTTLELAILAFLVAHRKRAVSRDELLSSVWGIEPLGLETRTVDMHIARLRMKLRDPSGRKTPEAIVTVRAHGYMAGPDLIPLEKMVALKQRGTAAGS